MDDPEQTYEWTVGYNESAEYELYPRWAHNVSVEIIHDDDQPFNSPRARYEHTDSDSEQWLESDTTINLFEAQ